jgi:hypothetical protein
MSVEIELHHGIEQVVRGIDVVVDGVVLVAVRFHRIGRGALFGEMDDRIRALSASHALKTS